MACSSDETQKANKLVDDANDTVKIANKNSEDGLAKIYSMEAMLPRIKNQNDLNAARSVANECISILNKAKDGYTEAANKLGDASKMSINDKFKEYLGLRSQEMSKRSEAMDTAIREPQALIQTDSVSEYTFKVKSITDNFKGLQQAADDLAKKADKLQEENKDAIKGKV
jgi:hypothetical protein